jgi:hypothetical protein
LGLFEGDESLEQDTVVDFELGFNPQETPPAGISVGNMDAELAALFSDEGDAQEPELEVAPLPKPDAADLAIEEFVETASVPKLDPDLPFHLAPWGLLVARKHGIDTASILERLQLKPK